MYSLNNAESRKFSRSLDHVNWWTTEARSKPYQLRSGSSMSEDQEIRNGWLTLPEDFKARFQQRQMMEKEQKMVAMYEAQQARALTRVSGNATAASTASAASDASAQRQGKVRQMFEERRTKAGIDKSYPLQPIQNNGDRNPPRKPLPNGYIKVTLSKTKPAGRPAVNNNSHSIRKQKSDPALNGAGDVNHNTHPSSTTANNNSWAEQAERVETSDRVDGSRSAERSHRLDNLEDETFPEDMALSPTPRTPRAPASPPPRLNKPPPTERRSPVVTKSPSSSKPAARPVRAAAAPAPTTRRPTNSENTTNSNKLRAPSRTTASSEGSAGSGEPCSICGRKFASDRLQKHEEICRKSNTKRRKPYDALKHRLAGTEAEPFIKQIRKLPPPGKATPPAHSNSKTSNKPLNNTWRQKHEEFINAIRAAKEAQAYVAAGGKLSDLPPPPPSENPDYVACPSCGRRFNQAAADRHIPKCQSYQFNKPKPQPARKR